MLTTQERLNEVFTSGNLRTNDLMELTNLVYPSIMKIIESPDGNQFIHNFPQFYKGINMFVDLININPGKAKELLLMLFKSLQNDARIKDTLSKSFSEKEISDFINSIDSNPQRARELLMSVAVGLDLALEKATQSD